MWGVLFACLPALILLTGCGTTARHTAYFSAVHPETKARNYYRVKVAAHSDNGITSWNTGWYSRRALDQIFGEIKTNSTDAADEMVTLYEDAFVDLMKNYVDALMNLSKTNEAQIYLGRINELVGVARFYLSAGATAKDAAENAGKRFVYSFTADPNLLERMVADAVENDQLASVINDAILAHSPISQDLAEIRDRLTIGMRLNREALTAIEEAGKKLAAAIAETDAGKKATLVNGAKDELTRAAAFIK